MEEKEVYIYGQGSTINGKANYKKFKKAVSDLSEVLQDHRVIVSDFNIDLNND